MHWLELTRIVNNENANICDSVLVDSDTSDFGGGFELHSVSNMVTLAGNLLARGLHMQHKLFFFKENALYLGGNSCKLILGHQNLDILYSSAKIVALLVGYHI